ncbi:spore-associated protein A [Kitasatospora viridis]|uniref:Spore-associated protein A n=1 Tax=Kitasatospora viridis TaxID=281105 RepID=A0A561UN24_9ACTN|nr:spore-associated protein A [Kitasatospora viridis]TWG00766.1 hypothetical protein FHX73_114646 [Kitasatospora viridis]
MKRLIRRTITSAAVLAAATAGLVGLPGTAQAAAYNGACGPGYSILQGASVWGGSVYLLYNGSTDCVVTVRNTPGAYYSMRATVGLTGGQQYTNAGNFTSYAGPVYVYAPGQCINWSGEINHSAAGYSDVHCG